MFASIIMFLGTLLSAFLVSQFGQIIAQLNAESRKYRNKMEIVNIMMNKLSLPKELRRRVSQYFSHLWNVHGTFDLQVGTPERHNDPSRFWIAPHILFRISMIAAKVHFRPEPITLVRDRDLSSP